MKLATALGVLGLGLANGELAADEPCRSHGQIHAQLEEFGYRDVQLGGEVQGRLAATGRDRDGIVSDLRLDTCSGEVISVKKRAPPAP